MTAHASNLNRLSRRAATIGAAALALSTFARADTVTVQDAPALHQRAADYAKAFLAGDLRTCFTMFPTRLFSEDAKAHNMGVAQAIDLAATEIGKAMAAQLQVKSFAIDDAHPRSVTGTNGKTALLLPLVDVRHFIKENKNIQMNSEVLAINEDGTWYLMPLEVSWQYGGFVHAYPEFQGLQVQHNTTELKD